MRLWLGKSSGIGSRFNIRVMNDFEARIGNVTPFVAPLIDIDFVLSTRARRRMRKW